MISLLSVMLSAVGFYFTQGLGDQWLLAWLAPIPVLWLAFGPARPWLAFAAAWAAYALGNTNLLQAYAGSIPTPVLVLAISGPALLFAAATAGAQRVQRAFGPCAAMFACAALWAGLDFVSSFNHSVGSISTPAGAEVSAPIFIQSASLVGFMGVTFLLGLVPAGIALSLRTRTLLPVGVAIAFFCANLAYGYVRMSAPPSGSIRVALINSN